MAHASGAVAYRLNQFFVSSDIVARGSCLPQARVGQAISEMEGACHQTWMAELAHERDGIGTLPVD